MGHGRATAHDRLRLWSNVVQSGVVQSSLLNVAVGTLSVPLRRLNTVGPRGAEQLHTQIRPRPAAGDDRPDQVETRARSANLAGPSVVGAQVPALELRIAQLARPSFERPTPKEFSSVSLSRWRPKSSAKTRNLSHRTCGLHACIDGGGLEMCLGPVQASPVRLSC